MKKDDVISINKPDLEERMKALEKKKSEANEVMMMVNSPGWKHVERIATKMIKQVEKASIMGVFKDYEDYWKKTADARALQRVIGIINKFENIRKR